MTRVFIFHGSNSRPSAHWFPWLAKKLKDEVEEVICIQMPGLEEQLLDNWLKTLEPYKAKLNGAILVGHSLGAPFILNVLNEWDVKVNATFLVAGFTGPFEKEGEDNLSDFSDRKFNWKIIKSRCKKFYVIHSESDQVVPIGKSLDIALNLGVDMIQVPDAGHFRAIDGWTEFPGLLMDIERELARN
ncbi:serine hydrolase family protein [Candidatus Woesearchaeota archaeon]|nr:serine hydrolase family protein [Candidatus Woesearchaeota archaeon]